MSAADLSTTLQVGKSPLEVFQAINNVRAWWSEDFQGKSEKLYDEFDVRFADVHYSRQRLIEMIPEKRIVWLVTESRLNFLKNKSEWTGTTIIFDIAKVEEGTEVRFSHHGLVPSIECFEDCSKGWNHFLHQSLLPFISTGIGNPNVLEDEIQKKDIHQSLKQHI